MPLAVKGRRERHHSAPPVRGRTDGHSQIQEWQSSASAETTRTLAHSGLSQPLANLDRLQPDCRAIRTRPPSDAIPVASRKARNLGSILPSEQALRDFHKPSGFTTGKDSLPRHWLPRSRPDYGSKVFDQPQRVVDRRMGVSGGHRVADAEQLKPSGFVVDSRLRPAGDQITIVHRAKVR
jgi:hypothetical protein